MDAMICKQCGAPLNDNICEYCGTRYNSENVKKVNNRSDNGFLEIVINGERLMCYAGDIVSSIVSAESYRDASGDLHRKIIKKRKITLIEV